MTKDEYSATFEALTGNPPFPWQWDLFDSWFSQGKFPQSCNLPTGLGKTSVIAVWLIALANKASVPRRLVYVVNRRTVVDQTTDEVEKYKKAAVAGIPDFALSTLRGQFADNRDWSADPSRPAVICGTVDMIGSRLLFSGYGVGMKAKPLHAGFLGQDALLVHDEAHLEPAFQELLIAIEKEQDRERKSMVEPAEWPKLRVMELTATSRGTGEVFELTKREKEAPTPLPPQPKDEEEKKRTPPIHYVWWRTHSKKAIEFHSVTDEKRELVPKVLDLAKEYKEAEGKPAILVFVRTVEAVNEVVAGLKKAKVAEDNILTLTGTMRGKERDELVEKPTFKRFLRGAAKGDATVYLVCTAAGEVGVDMSADHLVCDLSTYDSMAQRFGRVNRYGTADARIDIVYPAAFETKDKPFETARQRTLGLLKKLRLRGEGLYDASPASLGEMLERAISEGSGGSKDPNDRAKALREYVLAAFAPPPTILPTTDILFDAWALTTIRDKFPGRPPVAEYLHGVEEKEQYDTTFAWREEVAILAGAKKEELVELLDEFPLKPHESLRIPTFGKRSAFDQLEAIAERDDTRPVWVIDPNDDLTVYPTLKELLKKNGKDYAVSLASRTVVLPPTLGGLTKTGTLDGGAAHAEGTEYDVAGTPPAKVEPLFRLKLIRREGEEVYKSVAPTEGWEPDVEFDNIPRQFKPALSIDLDRETEAGEPADGVIEYVVLRRLRPQAAKAEAEWPALDRHNEGVRGCADIIGKALNLDPHLAAAVSLAAAYHDLGKGRAVWQRGAGNVSKNGPVAKTLHGRAPENLNRYRHELGSMVDAVSHPEYFTAFDALEHDWQRELVLHLIATHHGRGRPHFPEVESRDGDRPDTLVAAVVGEVPGRFARLQRKYGRWGLAYLESLVRAADAQESRRIESAPLGDPVSGVWPTRPPNLLPYAARPNPEASITVAVDPTNPGQFFACCGLLELADRLWPGAEGWFAQDGREFRIACGGTLQGIADALRATGVVGALTATLQQERAELEVEKRRLKRLREQLPDAKEKRRKELGTLYRSGSLFLPMPFGLFLDWWRSDDESIPKTWAGSQAVIRIALAAHDGCVRLLTHKAPFQEYRVMRSVVDTDDDEDESGDKVEPFYFDAQRGTNALSRDIGFMPDALEIETLASPVVEFLTLVGLQRGRPVPTNKPREFEYFTWTQRTPLVVLPVTVAGLLGDRKAERYRFRNPFRTGREMHKTFMPATLILPGDQS